MAILVLVMKVVVAHNLYSSAQPSGENVVVDTEMRLLAEAGVEVIPFLRSSDEIAGFTPAQKLALPVSPVYARRAQRGLTELIKERRPDVLHLHNPYPLLSPWVVRTAQAHGVPVVQTVHNFRHECMSAIFFRDGRPCHECLGRRWSAPGIKHGCYRGSRAQSLIMATALAVHTKTWLGVDRFLALTPAIARFLGSMGVAGDRIAIKPNSVPDPGVHAQRGDGFLFAARLSAEKGVDLLLDAWQRLPEGSAGALTVAGDGPLRAKVESVAQKRADLTYAGRLGTAELNAAMRAAAVVVVPSTCDDVSPMVVVEALANARPVLVTRMGGLPWLAGEDEPAPAGWVVDPRAESMAEGLIRAHGEGARLAPVARRRYETTFSPSTVTQSLIGNYRSMLEKPRDVA